MWKEVEKSMAAFFFSGSHEAKIDDKNRFVLPQSLRLGLVEEGKLEFFLSLGLGGCLTIYRKSAMQRIVAAFKKKAYAAKYQQFFTLFFSTLHETSCDKLGRVVMPQILKKGASIKEEVVISGVLNKIEIWPKEKYQKDLAAFLKGYEEGSVLKTMAEEAFSLLEGQGVEQGSVGTEPLEALLEEV